MQVEGEKRKYKITQYKAFKTQKKHLGCVESSNTYDWNVYDQIKKRSDKYGKSTTERYND